MPRSTYKGLYIEPGLYEKVLSIIDNGGKKQIKTWSRRSGVYPEMVGFTIAVHDGRQFVPIFISEEMVGHKLGEFVPTRTFRQHAGDRKGK